jgi:hypothetical protein
VADEPGPVYRASRLSRGAAWVVLACTAGMALDGILSPGQVPGVVLVSVSIFALLAWALLRLEVRATADMLVVCGGRRTRRFPWSEIRGFEVNRKTGNEVAVLLKGNAYHRLPIVDVATRKLPAEQARAELERYWRAHRR